MKTNHLFLGFALLGMIACQTTQKEEIAEVPKFAKLTKIWETDTVMHTPESVIYDEFRNVLYVANIAGTPPDTLDYDGFISILSTTGEVLNREWVTGISSTKGMGIVDSSLFVTDLLSVVEINIPTGEKINVYEVEGAGFLNDITVGPDKTVYVSDSKYNRIHTIKDSVLTLWHSDSTFQGSNGLLYMGDKMMVAGFGGGNLFAMDVASKTSTIVADSILQGDGINAFGEDFIVSCWGGLIYQVKPDGTTAVILDTKAENKQSADAWFVASTKTLYVPTFFGNTVAAYLVE